MTPDERREYKRQWHLRNRERLLAKFSAKYHANREAICAERRAAYAADGSPMKAAVQAYEAANRAKIRARQRRYRREHPEVFRAIKERRRDARARERAAWSESNRDRVTAYRDAHAGRYREYARKRYGLKQGAGESYFDAEWLALVARHGGLCAYCRLRPGTCADHRTPLSRGGANSIDNILPACPSCNSRKNNKTEAEFRALWPIERLQAALKRTAA